ncbi:uncharacterized protein [Nicotiana tomentosiformis]|uniref:uncharacterized protein n=1 Tax=Nicotiana tomentosiformis TaxID=4098 RepID=UPI00388C6403
MPKTRFDDSSMVVHEVRKGHRWPLPWAPGKAQFMLFMTNYVSKWVKAHAYGKVREKEVIDFIWDHIICRFGMPPEIVCYNGKQFIGSKVTKFLEDHKIKRILSTSYHPSGNGQAESTNKTILQNLKKRLIDANGRWKEVLAKVLWAYRTTSKSITGATPFSLVYGAEALILVEVGEPSIRF